MRLCRDYVANRSVIRSVFPGASERLYAVCANMYCVRGLLADEASLREYKKLLKERSSSLSAFRGNMTAPMVTLLATGQFPSRRMTTALRYYRRLKEDFYSSESLAVAAFLLPDRIAEEALDGLIDRSREIYSRLKKAHPLLTNTRHSIFALLMALSPRSVDSLMAEIVSHYAMLKRVFGSGEQLYTVCMILALEPGEPAQKAETLAALHSVLRSNGIKYGKSYELATLAAMVDSPDDPRAIAADIREVEEFLHTQKGYYGLFGADRRTRYMHAAMIVSDVAAPGRDVEISSLLATIAIVTAEQAAAAAAAAH